MFLRVKEVMNLFEFLSSQCKYFCFKHLIFFEVWFHKGPFSAAVSVFYIFLAVLEDITCECQRKSKQTFLFIAYVLPGSVWLNQKLSVLVFL